MIEKWLYKNGFWLLVILIAIILIRSCDCNGGEGTRTPDTISVVRDTTFVYEVTDTQYVPTPIYISKPVYVPQYKTDTLEISEVLPADTAAILARYYQKVYYSDTQNTKYGKVLIQDTVTQNRITSRRFLSELNIPVVKETITLSQPKRTVLYLGFSGMGNPEQPFYSVGADFTLQGKNRKMYGIGVQLTRDNQIFYSFQYKLPIVLKRNR